MMMFEPSRSAGLTRLANFLPRAGRDYADRRNHDTGVKDRGARQNVSQLSPWLHAGSIGEAEVVEKVLERHDPRAAAKFIAEVFWRIYFKGYLEQRPSIWEAYCDQRDAALAKLDTCTQLSNTYAEAVESRTGIAAFDHWTRELIETGYLHNHARMWFASIWIFTLKLDWTLGADFFLRHLMDGDAASNTLSWRWVGGLHTKGKTYLARSDNIARYTAEMAGGPLTAEGLASEAPALSEPCEHERRPLNLPHAPPRSVFDESFALLLHDEGASHVPLDLPGTPAVVIGAARPEARSPLELGSPARDFARGAVEAGMRAAVDAFGCPARTWQAGEDFADILASAGTDRVVLPYLPTGWTRDALLPQIAPLLETGSAFALLGDLDRATWPHAKAGFFGVKKKIEEVLAEVGISRGY